MGQLTPADTRRMSEIVANSTLRFAYCEGGPGRATADTAHQHCLVILEQSDPIRIRVTRNGRTRTSLLEPSDVAFAAQGSDTTWEWLDPVKVIVITLDPQALRRFVQYDMRLLLREDALTRDHQIVAPALAETARQLHSTAQIPDVGNDIVFDALARVFLVTLVRQCGFDRVATPADGLGVDAFDRLVGYIEARLDSKITPRAMAAELGMSEASFARKFRAATGETPMAFVRTLRLRTARQMLEHERISLGEISIRCGFTDQAHFSRAFRKAYGHAPKHYRSRVAP